METAACGGISYYSSKQSEQSVQGVWIKIYGPELDGVPVVRNWFSDPNIEEVFGWKDITSKSSSRRRAKSK